jgi:uncharacterized protein (DUF1330 family)
MSVYAIALVKIDDHVEYAKYVAGFMRTLPPYAGNCLSVDDSPRIIEGQWPYTRTVLLKFPNDDAFKQWYGSDAYQALVQHRFRGSTANFVVIRELQTPKRRLEERSDGELSGIATDEDAKN